MKGRALALSVIAAVLLLGTGLFGAEAAGAGSAVAEPGTTIIPDWLQWLVAGLSSVITALLAWAFKIFRGKVEDNQAKREAVDALEVGVTQAYHDLVKRFKEHSADGKLTKDEKKQCREYAMQKAKEVATVAGRKVLEAWGREMLETLVEKIVLRRKTQAE